jgi:hypothetical protein
VAVRSETTLESHGSLASAGLSTVPNRSCTATSAGMCVKFDHVGSLILAVPVSVWAVQGKTKVALYGLGFLREERLARAFQKKGQVEWDRPSENTEHWYNIFVLHQNRVQHYKQSPNNMARHIQESFLPDWLDLVRPRPL